ncbi:MAG: 2Fe-2S iron-sulfur cluster-binding protein [Geminicoccaceae bacterium]
MEVGPDGSMLATLWELGAKVDASSEGGTCGACEVHCLEGEPIDCDPGLALERLVVEA